MQILVVKSGDSLWQIARRFSTSVEAIAALNQLADPSRLIPGQSLVFPGGAEGPRRPAEVNAFVYPNAAKEVLEETLPYLTTLNPFSYRAEPDGTLVPPADEGLIEAALAACVAPQLVLTNLGENGGFSSDLAHAVLTDEAVQQRVLDGLPAVVREKAYRGVVLDFEYIYPFDRDSYSQFVRRMAELLHRLGRPLSVALAPKESERQEGLLYAAHDYAALGAAADRLILMTYEWGYLYGAPQAISPVDRMRRVLDYAVGVLPAGKLLLGFSNYAYDWTLPWKQGTAARVLPPASAQELAASRWAEIRYDETAQAPYFHYTDTAGRRHVVWFEDARSIRARLRLVEDYGLAGLSIWTADRLWRPALAVLESLFSVEKNL